MPTNSTRLIKIIKENKHKQVNASDIINSAPQLVTTASKLVKSNSAPPPNREVEKMNINKADLEKIYERMKSIKENNENIIKLFPDIELSIQILVSSILSPKNMMDIFLTYKLDKTIASPALTTGVLEIIKNYLTTSYKLETRLPEITREALFDKGAYVLAIIPESSVDEIINSDLVSTSISTEKYKSTISDMTKNIGLIDSDINTDLIGNYPPEFKVALEALTANTSFMVTDNYNLLKYPNLRDKIKDRIVRSKIKGKTTSLSLEALDYFDIFRNNASSSGGNNISVVKNKTETIRTSLGSPLIVKLNTESVIPIFTPGDPSNHIGYFVLLDENGYPVNSDISMDKLQSLQKQFSSPYNNNQSQMSLTQKTVNNLVGGQSDVGIGTLYTIYKELIEKQIFDKVKKGLYGANIELTDKNDIYFTMFTRALSNQKSSMLFIPSELVTYMAFNYNKNGTGKTLLENLSVLTSLRAIMLFAKIMAYSKSAIDVTTVNATLDPNDPDPEKTVEMLMDGVIKLRQNYFPLGINNPVDLVDWIQRAGLQFSYENHPGLPNVKLDFASAPMEHVIPSDDLEEVIRKQTIMSLGLSPETVDNGFSPEFATTIVNNNILTSKRTMVYQLKLEVFLKKIANMAITNDEELRRLIKAELNNNIGELENHLNSKEKALCNENKEEFFEYIIDKLAKTISITLPKPESTNLTNLAAEFDLYKENLEKALDSIISAEIISEDIGGGLSTHIDTIKNIYKHHKLREWMSENNFMPGAFDILKQTAEGDDKLDLNKVMKDNIASIELASADLFKKLEDNRTAVTADLTNSGVLELAGGEATTSSSSSDSSDNDGGDSGGGSDDFDMGDLGGDMGEDTGSEASDETKENKEKPGEEE